MVSPFPLQVKMAHCGSPTSHQKADGSPARIITCDGITESKPFGGIAACGDLVEPHPHGDDFHPANPIITCSTRTFVSNRGAARVGDVCECGAVILPDTPDVGVSYTE
jgi:uncharacterized Zn-binding protein involved in type VI secretion